MYRLVKYSLEVNICNTTSEICSHAKHFTGFNISIGHGKFIVLVILPPITNGLHFHNS